MGSSTMQKDTLRIIDANLNRASEGVRVCEEIARFVLTNKSMSLKLKKLRHSINASLNLLPVSYKKLLQSRDSVSDVGNDMAVCKHKKTELTDLLISNLKRSQEALRVLEEFSKLVSRKASVEYQKLRFKSYVIEKEFLVKLLR